MMNYVSFGITVPSLSKLGTRFLMNRQSVCCMAGRMLLLTVVALDMTARQAHAYIDPGAGSYAVQVAIAGLAGILVSGKLIFTKIRLFLAKLGNRSKVKDTSEN